MSTGGWPALLREIIELSGDDLGLRDLLGRIAQIVVTASNADVCFVHVVDREAGELVLRGATPPFDAVVGTVRLRIGEGVAGWVAEHGVPTVVADKWQDPRYRYIPALHGEDFSSLISLPLLRQRDRVVGVLNVHSRRADHFGSEDVARLTEVAGLLAGIVENAVLVDRLATREAELERFAAGAIETQERERRRLAADIHDGISQRLISAWYHLRAARTAPAGGVEDELVATEALLAEALDEARRAIVGLRPAVLDDLGLAAGLQSLAASMAGVDVAVDITPCALPPHVETALFRITQEALQNVVKHAESHHVTIGLREGEGGVTLSVVDDGVGFDTAGPRGGLAYGMDSMFERAALVGGRVEIRSQPGAGTSVVVVVPYERLLSGAGVDD
ncbi:MAG TPA: GAF domain-containing sensor histidine kinase [Acidimicrobiales bacterium]|nr:GAF domain-containing sensor histidine kinase [Acidimicrobiales bacterium]